MAVKNKQALCTSYIALRKRFKDIFQLEKAYFISRPAILTSRNLPVLR